MSQVNQRRHKVLVIALFMTAVCAALFTFGTIGAGTAHAHTPPKASCDINKFKNKDNSIDTTGYLACVAAAVITAVKPSPLCPTAKVQLAGSVGTVSVTPKGKTHFSATGFTPWSIIQLFICSTPVSLGSFTADANGTIDTDVDVPEGTDLGAHTIAATGARSNGLDQVAYAAVDVQTETAAAPVASSTPSTGSDNGKLIGMGAALVLLGGAAVFGSTRARRPAMVETD